MSRLIWIKNPKTGGTSIRDTLIKAGLYSTWEDDSFPEKTVIRMAGEREIYKFKQKHFKLWQNTRKFGVVRNPYTWFVSAYCALGYPKKGKSLLEVAKQMPPRSDNRGWVHMTETMTNKLMGVDGKLRVDDVIHQENLQEEFGDVMESVGLPRLELVKVNTQSKQPVITQEVKDEVYAHYMIDFKMFGYKR